MSLMTDISALAYCQCHWNSISKLSNWIALMCARLSTILMQTKKRKQNLQKKGESCILSDKSSDNKAETKDKTFQFWCPICFRQIHLSMINLFWKFEYIWAAKGFLDKLLVSKIEKHAMFSRSIYFWHF